MFWNWLVANDNVRDTASSDVAVGEIEREQVDRLFLAQGNQIKRRQRIDSGYDWAAGRVGSAVPVICGESAAAGRSGGSTAGMYAAT